MKKIVIIGGGQAGYSVAARLRGDGFDGRVTLVCAEQELPYQRPPLSKKYLLGELEPERLYLRPRQFYDDNDIELLPGCHCTSIDPDRRRVGLDGSQLAYDDLVIATGASPRPLPDQLGGGLSGVHTVRDIGDIDSMAGELVDGMNILVVGGGYIGLETAASLSSRECSVVVVEMADRILQRVAAPETSDYFRQLHGSHGVRILESTSLERLLAGAGGRVSGARLQDGSTLDVDLAVIGIGIAPETGLAASAGLDLDNGISTDALGRTSAPGIWAAGDCASFPLGGRRIRLESVQNAIDQAELVAANIMGAGQEYAPVPWFWSDQFAARLQIAGLGTGYDRIITRRQQDVDAASFWYFVGEEFLAVDAVNDARSYMVGKRLLETGKPADQAVIADTAANLKSLLR